MPEKENPPPSLQTVKPATTPELNFTPPDPARHNVNPEIMKQAERDLAKALEANKGKSEPIKGISQADADTMLKWAVENARAEMVNASPHGKGILTTPLAQDGYCGLGQSASGIPLAQILPEGNVRAVNVRNVIGSNSHAFLIVEMPVETPAGVKNKTFLVDPTYLQFAQPQAGGVPVLVQRELEKPGLRDKYNSPVVEKDDLSPGTNPEG